MPRYETWTKQLVGISTVLEADRRDVVVRHDIIPQDMNDLAIGLI